ncbi:unnamed protein product [Cuscuta campestris]|uniref:Uncharacterized protein n=1 Tax=Cuscuta campestris TaxID=132261 RepID=A0A484M6I2_9ASTE|nr:unnamed protein product [Cuscuta campestris]
MMAAHHKKKRERKKTKRRRKKKEIKNKVTGKKRKATETERKEETELSPRKEGEDHRCSRRCFATVCAVAYSPEFPYQFD